MSDAPIHSRPFSPKGRENYDHIFRKAPLTPGTIREYRSDCCRVEIGGAPDHICCNCYQPSKPVLTKIN